MIDPWGLNIYGEIVAWFVGVIIGELLSYLAAYAVTLIGAVGFTLIGVALLLISAYQIFLRLYIIFQRHFEPINQLFIGGFINGMSISDKMRRFFKKTFAFICKYLNI